FGIICWYGHTLRIDSTGFNNFLSISKLPLALLSLSLPFGVVVNNVHRTIQTDKQIKEAERKNKADSFYSHRKNTIEMFENLPFKTITITDKKYKLCFENNYVTYRYCYPFMSTYLVTYDADSDFIDRVKNVWLSLRDKINTIDFNNEQELLKHISSIENLLDQIHKLLQFKPFDLTEAYYTTYINETEGVKIFRTKFKNEWGIKDAINAYWHAYIIIIQAIEIKFDHKFMNQMESVRHYSLSQDKKLAKWEMFKVTGNTTTGIYEKEQK
ncbi:TPA: hypothetical protein ACIUCP_004776, partial [Salmonella enterica subsp. enterica serovar Typhimurium]